LHFNHTPSPSDYLPQVAFSTAAEITTPTLSHKQSGNLLRSALRHIYIQAFAIGLGILSFGGTSLAFSLTLYGKLEQPSEDGGNLLEHHIGPIWLCLMYACCMFGGFSVLAVIYKTYEPVLRSKVYHRQHAATQIKFKYIIKGPTYIRNTFFNQLAISKSRDAVDYSTPVMHFSPLAAAAARQRSKTVTGVSRYDQIVEEEIKDFLVLQQRRIGSSALASSEITASSSWDVEQAKHLHGSSTVDTLSPSWSFKLLQ
jgi:hypothetical protein